VVDASHLFVFCNYISVSDADVDEQMKLKSEAHQKPMAAFAGYGDFVKGKIKEKSSGDIPHWTAKQAYIALANAMTACAELKIDCTPMEGFDAAAYDKKLGLTEQGLTACVLLTIGHRHAEDVAQLGAKVRKPIGQIFKTIN
jgi:nitroreductase